MALQQSTLDITQRKMLRRIVGYVRQENESWEKTGRRMKQRLANALAQHPLNDWSKERRIQRDRLKRKMEDAPYSPLTALSYAWLPCSSRPRGRPRQRWTD